MCPLQGRCGRSEIQASHVPSAGQTRPGQGDPGLTRAHCPVDVAGEVQSRPHTCPLRGRRSRGSEIQASHAPSEGRGGRGSEVQASHAL